MGQKAVLIGARMRCVSDMGTGVKEGTLGTFTRGEDYVPGWDAGIFEVTLDEPVREFGREMKVQAHWTLDEMLTHWEPV
jgi:hypothetical protein